MSVHVLNNATVYLGNSSIDLSDHVESVELMTGVGNVSVTAMQDGWEDHIPSGVKRWSVRLSLYQDYDSSETYSVLSAALSTGVVLPLFVKATTASVSATNPGFSGSVVLDGDFAQIAGTVGDGNKTSVTLKGAGTLSFITTSTA